MSWNTVGRLFIQKLTGENMQYRTLGRTDIKVSAICLGTMTFGQQNTEAEGHEQLDYALSQGINFIDTAELYSIPPKAETQGSTETIIGTWLRARKNRDKIILASKVVGRSEMNWFRDNGKATRLTRAQIFEAIDKSLKRLQTDYIDLYQLHWPDRSMQWGSNPIIYQQAEGDEIPLSETFAALEELVKLGKIRFVGLSNESAWGTMSALRCAEGRPYIRVQSIQNAYNLLNRTFETALAEIAMREQVGLLAYSPLGQGFLTGKYQNGAQPKGARRTLFGRGERYETPGANAAIEGYLKLAKERGINPAQLALQFVTTRPFVTSNIIGATTMEQLKIDIDSSKLPWDKDLESAVNSIHLLHTNPCP
jgi:aryl-alcohol dehydrogenase-like predicted oxidoreductase